MNRLTYLKFTNKLDVCVVRKEYSNDLYIMHYLIERGIHFKIVFYTYSNVFIILNDNIEDIKTIRITESEDLDAKCKSLIKEFVWKCIINSS